MSDIKNKIVCLVGESGSGKTTLYDLLRERGHEVIDSYTTRAPRMPNELGHTFVTPEYFDSIRGDLAAYTEFDGYEYGTAHHQLEDSEFYIIDPAGVDYFAEKIGRENFVVVYIFCSSTTRYERLEKERGESHAYQRVHHDERKFKNFVENAEWDHIVHNEFKEQLEESLYTLIRLSKEIRSEV